jgi:hypothetical protein
MSDFYGKSNGYAQINWDNLLLGGSSSVLTTGTNIWKGGILPNNGVMTWDMQVVVPLAYSLGAESPPRNTGSYLYWYIDYAEWLGTWAQNGDANIGPWSYTYFSSSQASSLLAIGGNYPRSYVTPAAISNIFWLFTNAYGLRRGYNEGTLPGLELNVTSGALYPGGGYLTNNSGAAWNAMQTFTLTNKTGKDLYINAADGNSGTKTPIVIGWYGLNGTSFYIDTVGGSTYGGTRMLSGSQTVYGRPLSTNVHINGSTVTWLAPNGVDKAGLLVGVRNAINSAGIFGVSSIIDANNHLIVYGLTSPLSVTYGANGSAGSRNLEPSITNYL